MIVENASTPRELNVVEVTSDLVVVGGGLSGLCAAVAAAREGLKVTLIQDRPVLGGNASSEVRLWILGATSHGGNNNRWAREGGIINEILTENQFQNADGNPLIFDIILQDLVVKESNLTVLLNTSVFHADVSNNHINSVQAFNSQNSTMYKLSSPLFVDSSGDGILSYISGAAFRMGSEEASEFDEPLAPGEDYGKLLGHSLYFYSKDVGHAVDYVAPEFALKDVPTLIPRYKNFKATEQGCSLWWIEWGGRLDTIHQSEEIKFELQKIVYGVWDYIKNSGDFPEAKNLALEWVGTIPGKRESRRIEGDYILNQKDIVNQIDYPDNIAHGGWSIDLHPADGVYAKNGGCNQYHSKGIYGIPYRCMYSRNIENLFINGRLISASHVAFGSTRVMATSSAIGQAIGTAAALCHENGVKPRGLLEPELLTGLKNRLSTNGHYVPKYNALTDQNLMSTANIQVSSELELLGFEKSDLWKELDTSYAQIIPLDKNSSSTLTFEVKASIPTHLTIEVRKSSILNNHTPDTLVEAQSYALVEGINSIEVDVNQDDVGQYIFVCFMENKNVQVRLSDKLLTGTMTVKSGGLKKVSTAKSQIAPPNSGVDSFDFWVPERRPNGQNVAFSSSTPLYKFSSTNLIDGPLRPVALPNAWVANVDDPAPTIQCHWEKPISGENLYIYLDCDYDHPLESVQYQHHDRVSPYLSNSITVDINGEKHFATNSNRQAVFKLDLRSFEQINSISMTFGNSQGYPVSVLGIKVQ